MIKKFKVELEIEVDNKPNGEEVTLSQYIIDELHWSNDSFESMKVTKIKEVK